mgnify:CR=1 FL=1
MGGHKFDPKHIAKLEDPNRLSIEDPEQIFDAFSVHKVHSAVDIGAGTGFYTRPLLQRMQSEGVVWACDVSLEVLSWMRAKLCPHQKRLGLVQIGETGLPFASESVQVVVMANVLHEFAYPNTILQEVYRILAPNGRMVLVDWKKEQAPFGPPYAHRVSLTDILLFLDQSGFRQTKSPYIMQRHNAFLAGKNSARQ